MCEVPEPVNPRYPWYDSIWLTKYVRAKELIQRIRPDLVSEFVRAFDGLQTRPDFQVQQLSRVFDDEVLAKIKQTIRTLQLAQLETHEIRNFGRFVVHDHPFFTELQQATIPLVSAAAGEAVEASYNFLSIYKKVGVCPVHMDSPKAKWTLDVCIDQSEPWPIHVSRVLPWPEDFACGGGDWQQSIEQAPQHQFASYSLQPGEALVFSGSSQWHYRDPQPRVGKEYFCHLLFFHFVPTGMRATVRPKNWPHLFGIPELAAVI